ncbi:MAG: hypothetical protein H6999_08455 [Hahellaceae bacterium]|nr:hypothetical protein [Hahellaceae bacterium]MCP5169776.1 hypothetical protein [Hahellaceae bacterium]
MKQKSALPLLLIITALGMSACSTVRTPSPPMTHHTTPQIVMPMKGGWFEGRRVYYLTTDVSEPALARKMHANYVPRLRDALPPYPRPPTHKTVLERIYVFPDSPFDSVLPSIPKPFGPNSEDIHYSPLWLLYEVHWLDPTKQQQFKFEEDVLAAQDKGWVDIKRTDIVVNCPVVHADDGETIGSGAQIDAPQSKDWK